MRNTKARENETMAKFNTFMSKIKTPANNEKDSDDEQTSTLATKNQWMTKPLTFHIDSEKAYTV